MSKDETPGPGHNSSHAVAPDRLRSFCERIERVESEMADLRSDKNDIFAELKGEGFDAKVVRKMIALRKQDHSERQEFAALCQLYADALGLTNVFA
jgi:uncharacterized protein (UPF0335 family)